MDHKKNFWKANFYSSKAKSKFLQPFFNLWCQSFLQTDHFCSSGRFIRSVIVREVNIEIKLCIVSVMNKKICLVRVVVIYV